jgi:predicted NBD/HSP70 family sugar kinase
VRSSNGQAHVREANEYAVLRAIAEHAPIPRARLVEMTGLSRPTVLSIVSDLEETGLVRSHKVLAGQVGRAPVLYSPNPVAGHVVGIDLGGTKLRVAVGDLSGRICHESEQPTDRRSGRHVVAQINRVSRDAVSRSGVDWDAVAAVTVGSPGVVTASGSVELAENVRGLDSIDFVGSLRRVLDNDVRVENDVNLAAVAEHAFGTGRGSRSMALLAIGTGVGLGIIVNGSLLQGATGRAGEVAYLPIGTDPTAPDARERGAWEIAVSGSGFRSLAQELRGATARRDTALSGAAGGLDPEEILSAAARGERNATRIVEKYAARVAAGILSIAATLDPEMIVVSGGIGSNPLLLPPVRAALAGIAPFAIVVEGSRFGPRAGTVGALADAQKRAFARLFAAPDHFRADGDVQLPTAWQNAEVHS